MAIKWTKYFEKKLGEIQHKNGKLVSVFRSYPINTGKTYPTWGKKRGAKQ